MNEQVRGIYREDSYLLPRGRITAILTPDGAATRIEKFDTGAVAIRPMPTFEAASRCARDTAKSCWGVE